MGRSRDKLTPHNSGSKDDSGPTGVATIEGLLPSNLWRKVDNS